MDEMLDAPHSAKKVKKSTPVTDNNSPVKSETRQKRVLQNGTGNSSDDSPKKEQNYNPKVVITKISKTAKTEQSRGPSKSPNKQESDIEETAQCESPSALEPNDFIGFDDCSSVKPDIFQKLLQNLDNSLESDERNQEEDNELREDKTCEEMTVNDDTGHLSESESSGNSDQMEIDMGNDKEMIIDDPLAIIEKGDTKEDSDVEIMESDSVRSDSENNANNQDENTLNDEPSKLGPPGKGGQQKIEYCGSCSAVVDDAEEGICCDGNCERWFHLRCSGLSQAEYDELSRDENAKWACHKCTGKPQPPKAEGKPLLSVRKDLGNISTPSPTNKRRSVANRDGTPRTPRIDVSNPAFLKPFDFGWKRELVYRSTSDSFNRRQGDIYYYTPKGKKLRSLREISEHLAGTDLTQDNFTFWKEPLGTDDPNKEIIREAKLKTGSKEPAITPRKAIPKITKTPKTVPKLTATVSPMETTATPVVAITPKASASVTPRVVFKGKTSLGPKFKITPSKNSVPGQTPKIVINKGKIKKVASPDEELEIGMLPPTWDSIPKPKETKSPGAKRPAERSQEPPSPVKRAKIDHPLVPPSPVMHNFMQNVSYTYGALLHAFQYLKVQELLRASRVCHMWRDIALHKCLWDTVRMKNSHVKDWEGFAATLRRVGTRHLDLRKILVPDKPEAVRTMWTDCVKALSKVNSLVKLDLCRCTPVLLEQIASVCPQLEYIAAGALKSHQLVNQLNMTSLGGCQNLTELRLKGQGGFEVVYVSTLSKLNKLKHLSLTTMKNTASVMEVIGNMTQLESLELGDFLNITQSSITSSFSQLTRLKRLRLEKGQGDCPTDTILRTISQISSLVQLELINFDVKAGFEENLALCSNIRRLLIIPTYVTQSATTNHLVIEGVSKLASTLQHFVWGLTLELLRVTDLFIDQWEKNQKSEGAKSPNQGPTQKKSATGDSIPILKPAAKSQGEGAVTQVDVLQLPKLHKVLTTFLPTTKIIILKVPFSATWRQTISGSPQ